MTMLHTVPEVVLWVGLVTRCQARVRGALGWGAGTPRARRRGRRSAARAPAPAVTSRRRRRMLAQGRAPRACVSPSCARPGAGSRVFSLESQGFLPVLMCRLDLGP